MTEDKLTVGSLFSGIGGFDLGFERAGMTVQWQAEIDKHARRVLARWWPAAHCYDDVKEIGGSAPRVDVLCGGFPCQDLSVAGRRAGLAGERSGLFHEFMRVVDEVAPRWVVIENVPCLLSSNDGRDMGTVLGTLADLGYGWAYRVLDAQFFGVAQRRRRVFIVGCAGDPAGAASVLFEPESCNGDLAPRRTTGNGVAALTANGVGTCGADDNQGQAGHLIPTLTTRCGSTLDDQQTGQLVADTLRSHPRPGSNSNGAITLGFHQTQDPITGDDFTPALGATSAGMGVAYPLAVREVLSVRRLTPMECERLQGYPDGWTDELKDSARYRTLGNAVAVPVVEWIGRRIARPTPPEAPDAQ